MWDRKAERIAKYNKKKQQADYKKYKINNQKGNKKSTNDIKQNR